MIKNIKTLVQQFQPMSRWLVLYYANRCSDCISFKAVWKKVTASIRSDSDLSGINLAMIESGEIPKNAKVKYFPTLIYYNDRTEIGRLTDKNSKMLLSEVLAFVRKSANRPKTPKVITLGLKSKPKGSKHKSKGKKQHRRRLNRRRGKGLARGGKKKVHNRRRR